MPTFKHPCPTCGQLIARDVARCPFCGRPDPFVAGRCATCQAPIEDPAWVACAKCGAPLREGVAPMPGQPPAIAGVTTASTAPTAPPPSPTAPAAPAAPDRVAPTPVSASPAPVTPAQATTSPPAGDATCAGCGAPLAPGARFCVTCGTLAG